MEKLSIYIHIPFCEQKCIYCAFVSYCESERVKEEYFNSLYDEIKEKKTSRPISSIYIGGGTPSCVNPKYIEKILSLIYENYRLEKNAEITIECNPNSVTKEKLEIYKKSGVNRISFGVQSLNDKSLKRLGRLHNKEQVLSVIKLSNEVGIDNISVDFLLGIENQNQDEFLKELEEIISFGIKHISTYMLEIEDKTKLKQMIDKNEYKLPNSEKTIKIYEKTVNFLEKNGFYRYEISNFAKKGYESRHNINYWECGEYLGFGAASFSYLEKKRINNSSNLKEYMQRKNIQVENLSNEELIEEKIMLGLRCFAGFDITKLKELGYDILKNSCFNEYLQKGILHREGNIVKINPKFYGVSNSIICELLP